MRFGWFLCNEQPIASVLESGPVFSWVLLKLAVELTSVFVYGDSAVSCHCPPLAPKRRERDVLFLCMFLCTREAQ